MKRMSESAQQSSSAQSLRNLEPTTASRRIRFVTAPASGATVRREFAHPRRVLALEETVHVESIAAEADAADLADECFIVFLSKQTLGEARSKPNGGLPVAVPNGDAFSLQAERGTEWIRWRPGLAVAQCRPENREAVVAALVEFAFYERELRALEKSVEAGHFDAEKDIEIGHRVKHRDRRQWQRLFDAGERFSRLRLAFARLEPLLGEPSRVVPSLARRWLFRLLRRASVETRLEALSDRLEALEEFYESATQRIAEYRWYREGHLLEIGIIVILVLECALMGGDIYLHQQQAREAPAPTGRAK
jgi:hypothetical protein